ncbi:MAG: ATP-binding protein [Chloroflexi bacterium]|nr:ATP-binding protein [Chloroflexota bacterium]
MLLDEKPVEGLEVADIERLVSDVVCETQRLDYKRDWWGNNDDGKREMLRDISSFANAYGGHIVLGVETERGGALVTWIVRSKCLDFLAAIIERGSSVVAMTTSIRSV